MAIADYAVENRFFGGQGLLFGNHEWPRIAQPDVVTDFGIALVPDCQRVYRLFETLDNCFGGRQF